MTAWSPLARVASEPTRVLDLEDLQRPNEFDLKLLDCEGRAYEGLQLRGASLVPEAPEGADPLADLHIEVEPALDVDVGDELAIEVVSNNPVPDDARLDGPDEDFDTLVDPPRPTVPARPRPVRRLVRLLGR